MKLSTVKRSIKIYIYIYIRKGRAIVGTGENPKLQTYKNAYNTLVNCGQDDR